MEYLIPVVYALAGVALIVALIELARFLRSLRGLVDGANEGIAPIMSDVAEMTRDAKPAAQRIDPMLDRLNLTIDAANLEIMRVDGILENVDSLTSHAANAASAVEEVASTPARMAANVVEAVRGAVASGGAKPAGDPADKEEAPAAPSRYTEVKVPAQPVASPREEAAAAVRDAEGERA